MEEEVNAEQLEVEAVSPIISSRMLRGGGLGKKE
jgi:hypothetical protein